MANNAKKRVIKKAAAKKAPAKKATKDKEGLKCPDCGADCEETKALAKCPGCGKDLKEKKAPAKKKSVAKKKAPAKKAAPKKKAPAKKATKKELGTTVNVSLTITPPPETKLETKPETKPETLDVPTVLHRTNHEPNPELLGVSRQKPAPKVRKKNYLLLALLMSLMLTIFVSIGCLFWIISETESEDTAQEAEPTNSVKTIEAGINWPTVFRGGTMDKDEDGCDDRYDGHLPIDGPFIVTKWAYRVHPRLNSRIALPLNSKGAFFGTRPPLVSHLPEFGEGMRWIHCPLGEFDEEGKFVTYPGMRGEIKTDDGVVSQVQVAWVVMENGDQIDIFDQRFKPERLEVVEE